MKPITKGSLKKKLTFNKTTIAKLNDIELNKLQGGSGFALSPRIPCAPDDSLVGC
ncbi:MAG: hypothetical protein GY757_60790 [bacterium]|nr:hypothetical protein [bacterium]